MERWFSLRDATRLTYQVSTEGAERTIYTVQVQRTAPAVVEITTGEVKTALEFGPDKVTTRDGRVLLAEPLRLGASWDEGKGWRARVDAVDLAVTVPAGSFDGCVRIVSESGVPRPGRVTTTYCPGGGRVSFISDDLGPVKRHVAQFELVSVGQ
jgi:hypothetical protein